MSQRSDGDVEPGVDEDDESQWRFAVDEVGEDAPEPDTIDPETPVLENVVFVLLGVALSVFAFYAAVGSL